VSGDHPHAAFIVAMAIGAIAGWLDWRKGIIPNWLTLPALVAGPLFHASRALIAKQGAQVALSEGLTAVGGAALCGIVPLLLFRQGAMGGGDVKLLVALGAWLNPVVGIEAEMYGFFAAALLAPARLAYEGKLLATLKNAAVIGTNLFLPAAKQRSIDATVLSWFRLGPAVALGVALACYLHW
jgi:prepilin peptidase CpaA